MLRHKELDAIRKVDRRYSTHSLANIAELSSPRLLTGTDRLVAQPDLVGVCSSDDQPHT